ncbi:MULTISPECIES: ABC transporter ATP-binding protein [unclassified Streptomyces]|uniref:ABC transporter ATP-binding protein n=1 Tax=unclassified Streptomyces TaxID=2593676 RepID=UPI003415D5A7
MTTTSSSPLLTVRGLTADVPRARLVDGVQLDIAAGEFLALVGESGSGKSVTARALTRLDPDVVLGGEVLLDGRNLLALPERELRAVRGGQVGMVFQDPLRAFNPVRTVGVQVAEPLLLRGTPRRQALDRAAELLDDMGIPRARERLTAYPHELSGGMRQRAAIAMALIGGPRLLVADEPTTALDVRVQEKVLALIRKAGDERGLGVLFITHDLGLVAGYADRVCVMYSGRLVEQAETEALFTHPRHPYTRDLLAAVPRLDRRGAELVAIPGSAPAPERRPAGCAYHPRCAQRLDRCRTETPALRASAACHLLDPVPEEVPTA